MTTPLSINPRRWHLGLSCVSAPVPEKQQKQAEWHHAWHQDQLQDYWPTPLVLINQCRPRLWGYTQESWWILYYVPPRRPQVKALRRKDPALTRLSPLSTPEPFSTPLPFPGAGSWLSVFQINKYFLFEKKGFLPWLVWLSGLNASLWTQRLPVGFPVRAHAWVAGQVPTWGHMRGNYT